MSKISSLINVYMQFPEYHKIQTMFKRDEKTKRIIFGDWTMPEFEYLKNNEWVWTEKVDGTNIRVGFDGKNVILGGRTDNASIPAHLTQVLISMFEGTQNKQKLAEAFGEDCNVVLYGEGCGAKIQKGGEGYKADGADFVLFDVRIGDWWLERENVEGIAAKLGLKVAPILGSGTLLEAIELVKTGFNSKWGTFTAEGIVARTKAEMKTRKGERLITKIKHRDFGV